MGAIILIAAILFMAGLIVFIASRTILWTHFGRIDGK